eukprot:COSAG04_NODE_4342_length_2156_cov_9.708984_1_plen_202_part_00
MLACPGRRYTATARRSSSRCRRPTSSTTAGRLTSSGRPASRAAPARAMASTIRPATSRRAGGAQMSSQPFALCRTLALTVFASAAQELQRLLPEPDIRRDGPGHRQWRRRGIPTRVPRPHPRRPLRPRSAGGNRRAARRQGTVEFREVWGSKDFRTSFQFVRHWLLPSGSSIGAFRRSLVEEVFCVIGGSAASPLRASRCK